MRDGDRGIAISERRQINGDGGVRERRVATDEQRWRGEHRGTGRGRRDGRNMPRQIGNRNEINKI